MLSFTQSAPGGRLIRRPAAWLLAAAVLVANQAVAALLLDPSRSLPSVSGHAFSPPSLASGFVPVVFRPGRSDRPPRFTWTLNQTDTAQANALHWHMQNAMPWSVTIQVTLSDGNGGRLETSLALPPGPPKTVVIPMQANSPLTMGMRAPPPQPFYVDNEPVFVATSIVGQLKHQLKTISISMPTPDADQTVLIGKVFVRPGVDHQRNLYTDLIDCFGQFSRGDWPEKSTGACDASPVTTGEQVKEGISTAVGSDIATDQYGGLLLPDWPSTQLATGAFRTFYHHRQRDDELPRWLLLTPLGNPFFSVGVNAIQLNNSATFIEGREFMFMDLPIAGAPLARFYGKRNSTDVLPADAGAQRGRGFGAGQTFDFYRANLYRKHGSEYARGWQNRTEKRLRSWAFNTAAAWSDDAFTQRAGLAYTAIIHIHGPFQRLSDGHNWWQGIPDPFDPNFKVALEQSFAQHVPKHRDNKRLIGYFVDNELAWGNGAAENAASRFGPVLSALSMDANEPGAFAKRAFLQHLKNRYKDAARFAKAWQIPLSQWQQLDAPLPPAWLKVVDHLEDGKELRADLSELLSVHARQYFKLVAQTLRSFDPTHLYLGARFASRTPEAVAACAQYCDVVSFNLYVPSVSSGFEAKEFAQHHKPALLTEFHFGSSDRGPFWGGVMAVASEADRGPAYQNMIDSVLANRQFVGAHWFQYLDQPATGRWLDGENGHLGLVSITDTPWYGFTAAVKRANKGALAQFATQIQ